MTNCDETKYFICALRDYELFTEGKNFFNAETNIIIISIRSESENQYVLYI